ATSQERIARRRRAVERQPQDLAVEAAEIARVRIRRITRGPAVAATAVARADVEKAVWSDAETAAVVIAVVGANAVAQHDEATEIDVVAGHGDAPPPVLSPPCRTLHAPRWIIAGRLRVIQVEEPVACESGVEGEPEQPHLGVRAARQGRERHGREPGLGGPRANATGLLEHEEPAVGRERGCGGRREPA